MKWIDYRKKLGLGFDDNEKASRVKAQMHNFLYDSEIPFVRKDEVAFCNEIGEEVNVKDPLDFALWDNEPTGLQVAWIYIKEESDFFEYVVPPLEGFWWQDNVQDLDYANKDAFNWISVIRLPNFVTKKDFEWAVEIVTQKKKLDCSKAEFLTIDEGLCVQIMHIGPFDNELESVGIMDAFLTEQGYENDINEKRLHHEIYMSDARKVAQEKWKTVIRHSIKKIR